MAFDGGTHLAVCIACVEPCFPGPTPHSSFAFCRCHLQAIDVKQATNTPGPPHRFDQRHHGGPPGAGAACDSGRWA